jgi:hypothetical protein
MHGSIGGYYYTAFYDSKLGLVLRFGCERLPVRVWSRTVLSVVELHEPNRIKFFVGIIKALIAQAKMLQKPQGIK